MNKVNTSFGGLNLMIMIVGGTSLIPVNQGLWVGQQIVCETIWKGSGIWIPRGKGIRILKNRCSYLASDFLWLRTLARGKLNAFTLLVPRSCTGRLCCSYLAASHFVRKSHCSVDSFYWVLSEKNSSIINLLWWIMSRSYNMTFNNMTFYVGCLC